MKEQIEAILSKHNFVTSEFDSIFSAMQEVLFLIVDDHCEGQPRKKELLRDIANDMDDLQTFVDENES